MISDDQRTGVAFSINSHFKVKYFEIIIESFENTPETPMDSFQNILKSLPLFWNGPTN